jgi:hypothetical protein
LIIHKFHIFAENFRDGAAGPSRPGLYLASNLNRTM